MSNTSTVPITILEAVNTLLKAVGQAEVMSLNTVDTNEETRTAFQTISDRSVEVQGRGWHFNTEDDFAIEPDPNTGKIALPNNTANVVTAPRSYYDVDVTQRGGFLYDRKAHTFAIGKTVYVNLQLYFEFAEIPQPVRWYITAYAGRIFGTGRVPDSATYKFTKQVEDDAYAEALTFDQEARGVGLPSTSTHFWNMRRR